MASEILGLFGGQSPQQLRNAALDSMLISPTQMGSQGLLQQVVSMGRNAGTVAGMGAGRLLGGKVAGEVEADYIDQAVKAASGVKGTPAEKMRVVANFLADKPGMGSQYMKAMEEARNLEYKDLQMKKAQQDLRPEFKDIKVPVTTNEMGRDGVMRPVTKSVAITHKWNPTTNKYEPFNQEGAVGAPVEEPGGATGRSNTGQSQSSAEALQRRKDNGTFTNPVPGNNYSLPSTTLPPLGARGRTESREPINPEGLPSPDERPMLFR